MTELTAAPAMPRLRVPSLAGPVWVATLLGFWQLGAGRLFSTYYLSRPSDIALQLLDWVASGYLWSHLAATLITTGLGFVGAAIGGLAVALLVASSGLLDRIFGPLLYIAYALPKIVLAPALILWFGVSWAPPVLMAFVTAFFMVFFNAYDGFRSVGPSLLNQVRIMGGGPIALAFKVRLPAALPFVTVGLQQGLIYAFHGTIVGEMTASNLGMGYVLMLEAENMNASGILACLVVIGAVTFVLLRLIARWLGVADTGAAR
jgi:NitT/TauT family transport system permease protein